jgi:stage V sporulation protein R
MRNWRDYARPIQEAAESLGLRPRPIHYQEVDREQLYQIAAYGLPAMYSHWTFGRQYARVKTRHDLGLEQIYELICNLDPILAYLLADNSLEEQVHVMAHCQGHADLFDRNYLCAEQRRDINVMLEAAAARFARYEELYGTAYVESMFDAALTMAQHVTPHAGPRKYGTLSIRRRPFEDLFPEDRNGLLEPSSLEIMEENRIRKEKAGHGDSDLLHWIIEHAENASDMARDICCCVREVELYFLAQRRTKILHEGWSALWEGRILDLVDLHPGAYFASARLGAHIAGSLFYGDGETLNPYALGKRLLQHLEQKGEDIFAIVADEDDASFIRNYFSEDFVRDNRDVREMVQMMASWKEETPDNPLERKEPWQIVRDWLANRLTVRPAVAAEILVPFGDYDDIVILVDTKNLDLDYARAVASALIQLAGVRNLRFAGPDLVTILRFEWGNGLKTIEE